jgi:hypothetical protein
MYGKTPINISNAPTPPKVLLDARVISFPLSLRHSINNKSFFVCDKTRKLSEKVL